MMRLRNRAKRPNAASLAYLATAAFLLLLPAAAAQSDVATPPAPPAEAPFDLLAKVQSNMEKFVDDFSLIRYEEDLVQEKLKDNDKVAYQQEIVYDSIIRTSYDEGKLNFVEQRLMEKSPPHVESRPLLSTYGFSALATVFHPYYASSFRFTRLADDTVDGRNLARIGFEHIPGTSTPVLYQMIGADKPMELGGTAWFDPASGDIYRIDASFGVQADDPGFKSIRANLIYAPVNLRDESAARMLPATATIDLETKRQHWRNIHHFADYRKYRVSTNVPGVTTQ